MIIGRAIQNGKVVGVLIAGNIVCPIAKAANDIGS